VIPEVRCIRNGFSTLNQKEISLFNENPLVVGVKILIKGYSANSNECRNLCRITEAYFFRLAPQMEGLEALESHYLYK